MENVLQPILPEKIKNALLFIGEKLLVFIKFIFSVIYTIALISFKLLIAAIQIIFSLTILFFSLMFVISSENR